MAELYEMNPVARITVGTVGEPGNRTFYLQGIRGLETLAVILEKEQTVALAVAIREMLDELEERFELPPLRTGRIPARDLELQLPVDGRFRVAQLGLSYDQGQDMVAIVAQAAEDEELGLDPPQARFWCTRDQLIALSDHARNIAGAGRPICPLCGQPMDPEGHFCPRSNGHGQHT